MGAQLVGNFTDGAHIGGDILALEAIAARRGLNEFAVLETKRTGQAVDLRLRREGERRVGGQAEKASDAFDEFTDLALVEHVAEREHRHDMPHLGEFLGWRGADEPGGRGRVREIGKCFFERVETAAQRVIFGVRNRRRVVLVIGDVVRGDFGAEARVFGAGVRGGKGFDGGWRAHGVI